MNINIYQIDPEKDERRCKFLGLDALEHLHNGQHAPESSYHRVFRGDVEADSLEDIFRIFNSEGHRLHRGHSLSVSDIVEVTPGQAQPAGCFFCDSIGFKPVDFDAAKVPEQENLLRVLVIEPRRVPYESEIENRLEAMQAAVEGNIEFTYPFDDNVIVCGNDEAKLIGMEGCRRCGNDIYCGPLFLVGDDGKGSCISLTDEQIQRYSEEFAQPEEFSKEEIEASTVWTFISF